MQASPIFTYGFRCTFCGGPSRKSQRSIAVFLLFLLCISDKMEKFKERGALVKALKQSNQDTTCNTSIDDTVKFVLDTRKRLWKSVMETALLTRGFKYKAVPIDEGEIFQW